MGIIPLDDLTNTFLGNETGLTINDVGKDRNELYIRWLQSVTNMQSRDLTDLQNSLFYPETQFSSWLSSLGFSGSNPDMKRQFFSGVLSFYAPLTSNLGLITGDDKIWDFNGVDDTVLIPYSSTITQSGTEFCIDLDILLTETPVGEVSLIRKDNEYAVELIDGNTIRFLVRTGGTSGWTIANDLTYTIPLNTKTNLKCKYDGSNIEIYVDDSLEKQAVVTGNIDDQTTTNLYVGTRDGTGLIFTGEIYNLSLYSDYACTSLLAKYDLTSSKLGSEQVFDLSGNGNHGTSYGKGEFTRTTTATETDYAGNIVTCGIDVPRFKGGRFINDSKGWSDKVPEKAIEFDSSKSEYIDLGANFIDFSKDFTVGAYVTMNESNDDRRYILKCDDGVDRIGLGIRNGNNLYWRNSIAGGVLSSYKLNINEKHLIMFKYNSSTTTGYFVVDGVTVDSVSLTQTNISSNLYIVFNNANYWDGLIDNFIIWDKLLTGEQVMQQYLYNKKGSNYVVAPENVVGHWLLDEESQTQTDISGNGNDGTFYSGGSEATPTLVDGVYDSDTRISNDVLKGISIEEQRTNYILYSEDMSTGWSLRDGLTISSNSATSPNGTLTADTLIDPNTGTEGWIRQPGKPSVASTKYTVSGFFKNLDSSQSSLKIFDGVGNYELIWNWVDNKPIFVSNQGDDYKFEIFNNDWYRISMIYTTDSGASGLNSQIQIRPDKGKNGKQIYIWGAQLE